MIIIRKIIFIFFAVLNKFNLHFKLRFFGNILDMIRMSLLRICGSRIGKNSFIHPNVLLINPQKIIMGENSNIGSNSEIFNYDYLKIGDDVDIGTQFYINTNNHKFDDPTKKVAYQGGISKEIIIGSDIWIGARVTVLSGVTINNRVVIGAGSVVTSNLESGYLYAGVPAKKIKKIN